MTNGKQYNRFSEYLKQKFGAKVYKITLDAGFSCPNRAADGGDRRGNRASGQQSGAAENANGCIFCDEGGSFSQSHSNLLTIEEQIAAGIESLRRRFKAQKFMSYFQAYSNTFKPVEELKAIYDRALGHEDIVGISIGTRPDCVDEAKLDLIAGYCGEYETWIEYGLQSIHDKTLQWINRGHDAACFLRAYEMTKARGIKVCAHIILGLNETRGEMLETAQTLARLGVDGVKIHMLCALEGTELTRMYERGEIDFMDEDEYVSLVCDILEILPEETVIHRLAASGLNSILVAPKWIGKKFECLNKIDRELARRNSFQGSYVCKIQS